VRRPPIPICGATLKGFCSGPSDRNLSFLRPRRGVEGSAAEGRTEPQLASPIVADAALVVRPHIELYCKQYVDVMTLKFVLRRFIPSLTVKKDR
jgi:hypothetical protein